MIKAAGVNKLLLEQNSALAEIKIPQQSNKYEADSSHFFLEKTRNNIKQLFEAVQNINSEQRSIASEELNAIMSFVENAYSVLKKTFTTNNFSKEDQALFTCLGAIRHAYKKSKEANFRYIDENIFKKMLKEKSIDQWLVYIKPVQKTLRKEYEIKGFKDLLVPDKFSANKLIEENYREFISNLVAINVEASAAGRASAFKNVEKAYSNLKKEILKSSDDSESFVELINNFFKLDVIKNPLTCSREGYTLANSLRAINQLLKSNSQEIFFDKLKNRSFKQWSGSSSAARKTSKNLLQYDYDKLRSSCKQSKELGLKAAQQLRAKYEKKSRLTQDEEKLYKLVQVYIFAVASDLEILGTPIYRWINGEDVSITEIENSVDALVRKRCFNKADLYSSEVIEANIEQAKQTLNNEQLALENEMKIKRIKSTAKWNYHNLLLDIEDPLKLQSVFDNLLEQVISTDEDVMQQGDDVYALVNLTYDYIKSFNNTCYMSKSNIALFNRLAVMKHLYSRLLESNDKETASQLFRFALNEQSKHMDLNQVINYEKMKYRREAKVDELKINVLAGLKPIFVQLNYRADIQVRNLIHYAIQSNIAVDSRQRKEAFKKLNETYTLLLNMLGEEFSSYQEALVILYKIFDEVTKLECFNDPFKTSSYGRQFLAAVGAFQYFYNCEKEKPEYLKYDLNDWINYSNNVRKRSGFKKQMQPVQFISLARLAPLYGVNAANKFYLSLKAQGAPSGEDKAFNLLIATYIYALNRSNDKWYAELLEKVYNLGFSPVRFAENISTLNERIVSTILKNVGNNIDKAKKNFNLTSVLSLEKPSQSFIPVNEVQAEEFYIDAAVGVDRKYSNDGEFHEYYMTADQFPLLGEFEKKTFEKYKKAGSAADALAIRDLIYNSNIRLPLFYAKKYKKLNNELYKDIVQVANIGLLKAIEHFDESLGFKFSYYAYIVMDSFVKRFFSEKLREIRLPVHRVEKYLKVFAEIAKLPKYDQKQIQAVFEKYKLSREDQLEFRTLFLSKAISLDMPITTDNETSKMSDFIMDKNQKNSAQLVAEDELKQKKIDIIYSVLNRINPVHKDMFEMYHNLGAYKNEDNFSYAKIGEKHSLSREAIRLIVAGVMERIKKAKERSIFQENPS